MTNIMPKQLILLPFLLLLLGGLLFSLGKDRVYKLNLAEAPTIEEPGEPITNPNFYQQTKTKLIDERADFVEADLSAMKVTLYQAGVPQETYPILTKGREGSWWETPAGIYKVGSKAVNHFSSFGQVYQPWSIQFQGNFFIHGWPYYPDGTPVASSYSGGCIRLASADGERLFQKVKVGMPILVFEESLGQGDGFSYDSKSSLETKRIPGVSAESFLVADLKNNEALAGKAENKVLPITSITKLMTALVVTDHLNIERTITISPQMIIQTSVPRLEAGQQISIYSLLFPLLLESSNEAATAMAYGLGQERFIKLMNEKAQAIGMSKTNFADPSGKADENTSTAEDLLNLARYLYGNRSFILKMTTGHLDKSIYGEPVFSNLKNFNLFGDDPRFVGGKVGKSTAARETMLAVFEIEIKGEKRPISIIILGSSDTSRDMKTILDYIGANYGS